jgi:hypothetical protein
MQEIFVQGHILNTAGDAFSTETLKTKQALPCKPWKPKQHLESVSIMHYNCSGIAGKKPYKLYVDLNHGIVLLYFYLFKLSTKGHFRN